ncbi:hypothetical protein [Rhodococcus tibetensis]|uniref:Peptidase C39-like domain-containing protein n=1 Tax=Rhodococcus tibetensis TaxID=2965064 RepID=A0ABT1QF78_9NOCA|nr:hypothetical protein [Rhodococcus sp. FXJ9.536]MCQ4120944.1 hypothetical protein [Rhodococcus sp. FXJ9.536]
MFNHRIKTLTRSAVVSALIGLAALGYVEAANAAAPAAAASSTVSVSTMIGDPAESVRYWQRQHFSDCAEMAVASIVGDLTGYLPSEREILGIAQTTPSTVRQGPIFDPDVRRKDDPSPAGPAAGGTQPADIPVLFAAYNIDSVVSQTPNPEAAIEGVMRALASGHRVVAILDSDTIWNISGDRTRPDHAVSVIGIDTATATVYLNDSGIDEGRGAAIPVDVFAAAWATSDHLMVVAA